ncbi:hypothetical protein ES707_20278 [subsurface metagenome]
MKSSVKSKILILIALGILFALSPMITVNLSFIAGNNNKSSKYSAENNLDKENLKLSKISERIHIINNSGWVAFKNDGNCTGEGTYSDPYIIEDLVINGGGSGSCILIENSDVYFKIENCTVYNSGGSPSADSAGIELSNASNGNLTNNNCSNNYIGIYLFLSDYNTISGNTANNNYHGIYLVGSAYNTISGNTANNNYHGIHLMGCYYNSISGNTVSYNIDCGIYLDSNNDHNTISGNTANNNSRGIYLLYSDYNTISGNTANNNWHGIGLYFSYFNTISGNTANNNGDGICLIFSDYNTISGNIANNNNESGIHLWYSDYNTVSGNTLLGNDECIVEDNCEGNIFENNDCGEGDGISFELIIFISVISGAALVTVVTIFLIRHKRKRIQ